VLVTGAATGIGAATARALGTAGWRVAVNHRTRADEARAVADDITGTGADAWLCPGDVGRRGDVEAMRTVMQTRGATLEALVHNASAPLRRGPGARVDWDRDVVPHLETSARGLLNLLQVFRPMLVPGAVVLVVLTSALSVDDGSDTVAYLAGKGALLGLCRGWSRELAAAGVRLVLASPGATRTGLLLNSVGPHPRAVELFARHLDEAGAARPEDIAVQLHRLVETPPVTVAAGPPHVTVDRAGIRRLDWVEREIV
jgi:NAD(P)-dependent dehydrogenase (short-subunit alcohol dehydrogenase family)